jgi:uncharacterized protein
VPLSEGRSRRDPYVEAENEFFWRAAAEGRLEIQACADCGLLRHPPAPMCAACHSSRSESRVMSGRGRVTGAVNVHYPPNPWFELPITVGTIELEEGVEVTSNVCDVPFQDIRVGMEVEVFFVPTEGGYGLPLFRPVAS